MSAPTPNSLKKMHDEKRASKPTLQGRESSSSTSRTSTGPTTTDSKRQSSPKPKWEGVQSSTRGLAGRDRTGKSNSSRGGSETMVNTRQNPKQTKTRSDERSKHTSETSSKKSYVKKDHLTQKPLREHSGLKDLKKSLSHSDGNKREYRVGGRKSGKSTAQTRRQETRNTNLIDRLRSQVDTHELLDISNGSEKFMGVSIYRMIQAINALETEGYHRYYLKVQAIGSGESVIIRVLATPHISFHDLVQRRNDIRPIEVEKENN